MGEINIYNSIIKNPKVDSEYSPPWAKRNARRVHRAPLPKVNLSTFAKTATIPKSTRVIN